MNKVALLTINDDNNYGNRLQNYAVQEIITRKNVKVETIINKEESNKYQFFLNRIKNNIKCMLPLKANFRRYKKFKKFNKKIKFSKFIITKDKNLTHLTDMYDYFFTGSDQVWNPNFNRMTDIYFLKFAQKEKRNSFSASFGISEIPKNLKEYCRKSLLEMNHISVREERGKKIVQELTKREDVDVLVDPTMLLTAKEWDKVSKKPKQLKTDKYILNYFLGEISENRKKEIDKIAKENGCEVINILDKNDPFYETGPSEFLYLEKNAFLICTDSFHSCVFSILYNRPFIVFDREQKKLVSMNSRIDTLLSKFKLEDRRYKGKIDNEDLLYNYDEAYKILEKEREKSKKFLKKALDLQGDK